MDVQFLRWMSKSSSKKWMSNFYPFGEHQVVVDQILRDRGYTEANWITKVYDGTGHNEDAWRARLHEPLEFLLAD